MSNDTGLSADHDIIADFGASTDAGLGSNHRILTHFNIMGDLDEVIEFSPGMIMVEPIVARSIGICPNLHMVFNNHIAYLGYFFIGAVCLGRKAKSIAANDRSGMDGYIVANNAIVVNFYPGMYTHVICRF